MCKPYDPMSEPPADIRCDTVAELFARSNVITLHFPQTRETLRMVNADLLRTVRPGAILVNVLSGDEAAAVGDSDWRVASQRDRT